MTPVQVAAALHTLISVNQPTFIWGPPGVGKSCLVAQVACDLNMDLRDIRAVLLDPVDLRGLPRITAEGIAQWCPPAFLPCSNDEPRGLLFLDELNTAPPLVQAACYQLILDRRIGEYRLPDGWCVIAAGNREKDRSVTHRMPSALANRMVHIECDVCLDDWLVWARTAGIKLEIMAFLRFRPKLLHDFDPRSSSKAFASPRSWEFLSRIMDSNPDVSLLHDLAQGTVGIGAAAEFMGFLEIWRELPSVEEILSAPDIAYIPSEPAALYALCEALASIASKQTVDALVGYAGRLPAEFGVLLMRDAVCHDESLVETPAFGLWAKDNAHVLM